MEITRYGEYDLRLDYSLEESRLQKFLQVGPRDVEAPGELTFVRNVFLPLTTACRYTCTYCTYFDPPGQASLMDETSVKRTLRTGLDAGCREALFTFGDRPDARYEEINRRLERRGYESILDFLEQACEWALDEGLLPHSNPGDLSLDAMRRLKPLNASMGVMLETTADVDAHSGPRRKNPRQRLQTLEFAGRLRIPFTTGLLVGIGDDWRDRAFTLWCIRRAHEAHGHVQEVIVQNVVPNDRSSFERPSTETMRRVVAMARYILPDEVEVQVPPNLSSVEPLIECGVGDLGGVSPVTDDYINPDYRWPAVESLEKLAAQVGLPLRERRAVYDRYLEEPGWVSQRVRRVMGMDPGAGDPKQIERRGADRRG